MNEQPEKSPEIATAVIAVFRAVRSLHITYITSSTAPNPNDGDGTQATWHGSVFGITKWNTQA